MNPNETITAIAAGRYDKTFAALYGATRVVDARARYTAALEAFASRYGTDRAVVLCSVPGRSEVCGNHTDHNHGEVICTSVDLDAIAVAARRTDGVLSVTSAGFGTDEVQIADIAVREEQFYTSQSLLAGVYDGLSGHGFSVGGMDAYVTSDVFPGSGLSSSAAYEVMLGKLLSVLWCADAVDAPTLAMVGQYAENVFFGKPSGLMDQVGCAVGGMVHIDFADTAAPKISRVPFDLSAAGYRLCIVNTGGSHANLNDDYAAVPQEMRAVAKALGVSVLAETDETTLLANFARLRTEVGDRAILRAMHFFAENGRVRQMVAAMAAGDVATFLQIVRASGKSSFTYLQNVYPSKAPEEQGLSLALCLAEKMLGEKAAAWRVHGGGFAGTVQLFLPAEDVREAAAVLDGVFGEGATKVMQVRTIGATAVIPTC